MPEDNAPQQQNVFVENMPDRSSIFIENELLPFLLRAYNRGDRPTVLLTEDDGTLRAWSLQVHRDANGHERVSLVEADGTLRQQMVLWEITTPGQIRWRGEVAGEACASLYGTNVSGAVTAIENEDTGELRNVPLGADEAGNLDRLRTDPNRIQWVRPYEGYVQVDPVVLPAAEGVVWNPGATAAELYEVSFLIVNGAGAIDGPIDVGVDIAAGGALAIPEFWMYQETIVWPGASGWRGPFLIAGDDDVRASNGAGANRSSIHFRVRRVDVGA